MNRKIVQKVIDELSKPTPDISYVRGILETVLETLPSDQTSSAQAIKPTVSVPQAKTAPSIDVPVVGGPLFDDINKMISTE